MPRPYGKGYTVSLFRRRSPAASLRLPSGPALPAGQPRDLLPAGNAAESLNPKTPAPRRKEAQHAPSQGIRRFYQLPA